MADAGSRAWTPPYDMLWSNLSSAWQQISVPETLRKVYMTFSSNFNLTHWPLDQDRSTPKWCSDHDLGVWLPADTEKHSYQLALFAVHYWCSVTATGGKPLSANTVLFAVSHISWFHMRERGYSVGLHAGHKMAVRGMERLSPPTRQKQPITLAILREIRSNCNFRTTHDRVLWGAAVVGFFFLLRRSEYLADGSRVKPYIIRTTDIKFITDQGTKADSLGTTAAVSVNFRGSKTDQAGSGTTRTLHRSGSSWLCPVLVARELVQIADTCGSNEALCSTAPGRVLTANTLGDTIKRAARIIGADLSRFGTHSMRSGGATAMFTAGVNHLAIKLFGRWTSDAFERYTRLNDTVANSLAQDMMQGAKSRVSSAAPKGLRPAQHSSWTS